MTRKPPKRPRKDILSPEDRSLWESTASTLEPLKRARPRVGPRVGEDDDGERVFEVPKSERVAFEAALKAGTASKPEAARGGAAKAGKKIPELNPFDRKAARKLKLGQIAIEARIDLHGMRQAAAHTALRRFLFSCHARGQRWVLVITGKGGPARRRDEDEGDGSSQERGVLKRTVPQWLAEPELRAIVVSYRVAAIPHGGEGALYVQLRNRDRMG